PTSPSPRYSWEPRSTTTAPSPRRRPRSPLTTRRSTSPSPPSAIPTPQPPPPSACAGPSRMASCSTSAVRRWSSPAPTPPASMSRTTRAGRWAPTTSRSPSTARRSRPGSSPSSSATGAPAPPPPRGAPDSRGVVFVRHHLACRLSACTRSSAPAWQPPGDFPGHTRRCPHGPCRPRLAGSGGHPHPLPGDPPDPRRVPRRHHSALCRRPAQRHRLLPHLRDPVAELRLVADRRRPGDGRRGAGVCARRPRARAAHACRRAVPGGPGHCLDRRLLQRPAPCPRCLGHDARQPRLLGDRHRAGHCRRLDRLLPPSPGRAAMNRHGLPFAISLALLLGACGAEPQPIERQVGPNPELPEPHRGVLPNMTIASPAEWGERLPVVPEGFEVRAIATGLGIPRQTLVLPNGDILVAEGRGGNAPSLKPKDLIANIIKARGTTSVASGDRLTLLRDADGDGDFEFQTVFAENLDAPYGLALVGNDLYVANQDAVVRFDYQPGMTQASGPPEELTK